jgi:pyruvate formate lyase activating enzyme
MINKNDFVPEASVKGSIKSREALKSREDENPVIGGITGAIARIERYMIHDGPGIRTVVFFKGCPLRCAWCSSPQTWKLTKEVIFLKRKCINCGSCVASCHQRAIEEVDDFKKIDRAKCNICGECVEICPTAALKFDGCTMSPEEVVKEVMKDEHFYKTSGGGVTLSGGEPLGQPEFAYEILRGCKEEGLHTAMETCAHADWSVLRKLMGLVDLFLIDLKHMNTEEHLKITGMDNGLILDNTLRLAKEKPGSVAVQFPVVPGYNDSKDNIESVARFMRDACIGSIDVIPFHKLGQHEYEELGLEYKVMDVEVPETDSIQEIREYMKSNGFKILN